MLRDFKEVKLEIHEHKLIENGWGYDVSDNTGTFVFFYNSGSNKVKGYLSYPKNISRKLPVIIWNRGGNDKSGRLDDFLAAGMLGEIASWGYIVFASQYRDNDEFGGKDLYDVLNLINEAKLFEFSDGNRIGMEGWSRGGMMSYLALSKTNDVNTCIIIAGLADLIYNEKYNKKLGLEYKKHFGTDDKNEFVKKMKDRSAKYWPDKISENTSILFIHGTDDDKISVEDSKIMYEKLSELNKNTKYDLKIINGGDHFLKNKKKEVALLRRSWFKSNLQFNS